MRLFVAIDLDEAVRSAVADLQKTLKRVAGDLRWVRPESMHLTLKFIGHVEESCVGPIAEALREVGASEAAEMEFRGLGYFPNPRRPRVLWVGIQANAALAELAAAINERLSSLGIERETRPFSPHLTLARFPQGGSRNLSRLQEEATPLAGKTFGSSRTETFFLFQSQLSPAGAKYTKLERFELVRSSGS